MWPAIHRSSSGPSERCSRQGITLVELLICAGLMSLIMLGTYAMLALGLRQTRKAEDSYTAFQRAFLILRQMELDASYADRYTLQFEPDAFAFNSSASGGPVETDPAGRILWQKQVTYLRNSTSNELFRYERDLTTPNSLAPEISTPLIPFSDAGWRTQLLSERVTQFEVEGVATLEVLFTVEGRNPQPVDGQPGEYESLELRQALNLSLQP